MASYKSQVVHPSILTNYHEQKIPLATDSEVRFAQEELRNHFQLVYLFLKELYYDPTTTSPLSKSLVFILLPLNFLESLTALWVGWLPENSENGMKTIFQTVGRFVFECQFEPTAG